MAITQEVNPPPSLFRQASHGKRQLMLGWWHGETQPKRVLILTFSKIAVCLSFGQSQVMTDTTIFWHPDRFNCISTFNFQHVSFLVTISVQMAGGKCFLLDFKCLPMLLAKHSLSRNMTPQEKILSAFP